MTSEYALTSREAIAKIREHGKAVLAVLPKTPLHEVPLLELIRTTQRVLQLHRDFKELEIAGLPMLVPASETGTHLYSFYEVGHFLVLERIASRLKAERALSNIHGDIFKNAIGKLFYAPPKSVTRRQLTAIKTLVNKMGRKKANLLMKRTISVWQELQREYNDAMRSLAEEDKTCSKVSEMFSNPVNANILWGYAELKKRGLLPRATTPLMYLRDMVNHRLKEHRAFYTV